MVGSARMSLYIEKKTNVDRKGGKTPIVYIPTVLLTAAAQTCVITDE